MARAKDEYKIEQIFKATLSLVLKNGYADLTMSEIAKEAGIATGTLYLYYKNKEELINAIFIELKTEKIKLLMANYDPADSFFVTFKKIWLNFFQLSLENPHKIQFVEQYHNSSLIREEVRQMADEQLQPLIILLKQAQNQQLIKNNDPEMIINHVTGSITEIAKFFNVKRILPDKEQIEAAFEMSWNSIRK